MEISTRRLIFDIEADGLLPNVTTIWCVVAKDIDTGELFTYRHGDDNAFLSGLLRNAALLIGHNAIAYDVRVLSLLWGIDLNELMARVGDTLVLSRLIHQGRDGHSLEDWGQRLNFKKGDFNDFSKFSEEMLEYCINDVHLTHKVYDHLMAINKRNNNCFDVAIQCETEMQKIMEDQSENGFAFDCENAKALHVEISGRLEELSSKISLAFPPKAKAVREITPRLTKHGTISRATLPRNWTDLTQLQADAPFTLIEWENFNPTSPKQVVERLWEAGWKPVDKTKGHLEAIKAKDKEALEKFKVYGYKVNENNIATLPDEAPEACRLLVQYLLLDARRRTLEEWIGCYNERTKRIHGKFNSLGTRTQRCSHSSPNLGNVATKKTIKYNTEYLRDLAIHYGGAMRSLWHCDPDSWLVGCDMESAHLRIFAHFINDKEFIQALISGDKKLGTDPHSLNKRALGDLCVDRDRAKTFIFSFLNGAGAAKVSEIFDCSFAEAKECLTRYVDNYPGLRKLKEEVFPRDAARGYFVGVDGRLVKNDSEHHMMGMYLQNMESVLMKHAYIEWRRRVDELGIRYKSINFVHDEFVTEVYGDKSQAEMVGQIQSDCIKWVGEKFNLRCPMSGEWKVGKNWLEVH